MIALLALWGCGAATGEAPPPAPPARRVQAPPRPNILVVIADDLGVDKVRSYGHHPSTPATPTLDALASQGVSFDRAWAMPVCSPTRATLLTGRYPFRTGLGLAIQPHEDTFSLARDTWTLPEMLAATTDEAYVSGAFGKWHLGLWVDDEPTDPNRHGFDHYAGALSNFKREHARSGRKQSYFSWDRTEQGATERVEGYATTVTTDDALAFIGRAEAVDRPWFAWVAYNAPHSPYHLPPGVEADGERATVVERYDAMVEKLDAELGRLIAGLGEGWREETLVVFIGDNGTPDGAVLPPAIPDRSKHTVYEGGVKVPLIVAGPGVARGARTMALASAADLYATVAAVVGTDPTHEAVRAATDSVSLVPVLTDPTSAGGRTFVFAERFAPNGVDVARRVHHQAIRDDTHKLIRFTDGAEELYALGTDWLEGDDLLKGPRGPKVQAAKERLGEALARHAAR